jgi:transcriptional regulator with XRE-family HTH domain
MNKRTKEEDTLQGRMRLAMAQQGLRGASDLARKMGVGRQTVHRWLTGKGVHPEPLMLFTMADVLKVNARWLALGEPNSPVKPAFIDPDEAELLHLRKTLVRAGRQRQLEDWVSQGRNLAEAFAEVNEGNPYPRSPKK